MNGYQSTRLAWRAVYPKGIGRTAADGTFSVPMFRSAGTDFEVAVTAGQRESAPLPLRLDGAVAPIVLQPR